MPPQPEPPYPPFPPFPPEPPVPPIPPAPTVNVGTTVTGVPGTNAMVTNSGTDQNAILNFVIPRGAPGVAGQPGTSATVTIGTTTTGTPGTNAVVTNSGTANNAVLNFTIPAGETGTASLAYGIFTAQPYTTASNNAPMIFTGTGSSADISLNTAGTAVTLAAGGVYDISYVITGTAADNLTIIPHHNGTAYTFAEQITASPTGTTASTISASGSYIVNASNTAVLLEIYVSSETETISNLTGILSVKKIA